MISFFGVHKGFEGSVVLNDINFEVSRGEMVCLIGKSGVGKSTITHMCIGAEVPDHGEVIINNNPVHTLSGSALQRFRQGVGFVFQDYKLLPEKTVFENISFALQVTNHPWGKIHKKTLDVLHSVGMLDQQDRFPPSLSGGEKQRVAIARALVHAPDILIADEPTGNLDPENTSSIAQVLRKVNQEHGTTILLTTHSPAFVKELSPRILLVEHGKIAKDLAPGALFPEYRR